MARASSTTPQSWFALPARGTTPARSNSPSSSARRGPVNVVTVLGVIVAPRGVRGRRCARDGRTRANEDEGKGEDERTTDDAGGTRRGRGVARREARGRLRTRWRCRLACWGQRLVLGLPVGQHVTVHGATRPPRARNGRTRRRAGTMSPGRWSLPARGAGRTKFRRSCRT